MVISRRDFLAGVGGVGISYAVQIGCGGDPAVVEPGPVSEEPPLRSPDNPGIDYRQWLVVEPDSSVTAYTCRVEIGQGLKTALYNVLSQGMELPMEKVRVVMGDTELCPADGPTTGSAATQYVVWGFWQACPWIQADLVARAADHLKVEAQDLEYREGAIVDRRDGAVRIAIGELVDGSSLIAAPDTDLKPRREYVDRETLNVNGEAIVTGTLQYAGDLYPEGCLYGGKLRPVFHKTLTELVDADIGAAKDVPGVVSVQATSGSVLVFGQSFKSVQKGLAKVKAKWSEPDRSEEFEREKEIRSGAKEAAVLEERGQVHAALEAAEVVVKETYTTQYASQASMETHTAVAETIGKKAVIWTGTQNPLLMRFRTARRWDVPEEQIRVVGLPVGGAFGSKTGHRVATEAANMSRRAKAPIKYVYTRAEQFNARSRYKDSVIVDISSGLTAEGRLTGRRIDIYQDEGFGTEDVYFVPHVLTRLYKTRLPVRHAVMRGTSYVQVCYALESHTDMVARAIEMDPLEFRKLNVSRPSFRPLLETCGDMIGWRTGRTSDDQGVGIALCHHGGRQLGVVAAEVTVDRSSGRITVDRLCGTFDIGLVINRNTLTMGTKGAMLWGLGYALREETALDGHRSHTTSFADYHIARFSDTPPIEVAFLDNEAPGAPRGCGELPVIPTVGAICNAVYDAIGVRFYELPMTPERVKQALAGV